jgi:hypothetical protein
MTIFPVEHEIRHAELHPRFFTGPGSTKTYSRPYNPLQPFLAAISANSESTLPVVDLAKNVPNST